MILIKSRVRFKRLAAATVVDAFSGCRQSAIFGVWWLKTATVGQKRHPRTTDVGFLEYRAVGSLGSNDYQYRYSIPLVHQNQYNNNYCVKNRNQWLICNKSMREFRVVGINQSARTIIRRMFFLIEINPRDQILSNWWDTFVSCFKNHLANSIVSHEFSKNHISSTTHRKSGTLPIPENSKASIFGGIENT